MNIRKFVKSIPTLAIAILAMSAVGQDTESDGGLEALIDEIIQSSGQIEETVVIGRARSSAGDIVLERIDAESVVDILGADQIARIGDSTVAQALVRVPGVTLVNGQFIYVRGLGERYSSTLLNGASVPSPDLTRSVLPLDIFPASILESIAVEKGFTANKPAAFGGGNIDIRTKGAPDDFVFSFELGTNFNTDSTDNLSYAGGSDDIFGSDDGTRALSADIRTALQTLSVNTSDPQFDLSPRAFEETALRNGEPITFAESLDANRALATTLNRDLDVRERSSNFPRDLSASASLGDVFFVGDRSEIGVLASVNYGNSVRSFDRIVRVVVDPEEEFSDEFRTTQNISLTGSVNAGWHYGEDHELETKNLFLRNTDDEASITDQFGANSQFSSGSGNRSFDYRFEQRDFFVRQYTGKHFLGAETQDILGLGDNFRFLEQLELNWFVSTARSTTEIPSETSIGAIITRDVAANEVTSQVLATGFSLGSFRFTDLEDDVDSAGWELSLPILTDDWEITLTGGAKFDRAERRFEQLDLTLGTVSTTATDSLSGTISESLSDENLLNPDFAYLLNFDSGNSRSYVAASITDAYFGQVDLLWNYTWRATLGLRYEDYTQFSTPLQLFTQSGSELPEFQTALDDFFAVGGANGLPEGVFIEDDFYPTVAFTYSRPGFFGAEDFNLRFAASETVVRPDLREISDASYLDPLTDIVVNGNPNVIPSPIRNFDARAEWFFENGDNLTFSLFFKDIDDPIELFLATGAEDSLNALIGNATSGESSGLEIEFLKHLDTFGAFASQFFLSGNLTLADSEIDIDTSTGEFELEVTNLNRPLTGASDVVFNLQVGFDSNDGKHSGSIAYNTFGERVFAAGVEGLPDAFEQPFQSIDLAYQYYASNNLTIKARLRNLLDEEREITQGNVTIFEQTIGQTLSLNLKYDF